MENVYGTLASILFSVIALILGLYVLRLDPKHTLNRLFLLVCLAFIGRNSAIQVLTLPVLGREGFLFLYGVDWVFVYGLYALNLHFYLRMKDGRGVKAWKLVLVYLPAFLLAAARMIVPLDFMVLTHVNGTWRLSTPNPATFWMKLQGVYNFVYVPAVLYILTGCLGRSRPHRERRQAAAVLISYLVQLGARIAIGWVGLRVPGLFAFPTMLYLLGVSFAVFRYRLLVPPAALAAGEFIANIDNMVLLLDAQLRVVTANLNAYGLLSARPESLHGLCFNRIIHPDSITGRKLERFLDGPESSLRLRLTWGVPGRTDRLIADTNLSKVRDRYSDTVGIVVVAEKVRGRSEFRAAFGITDRELEIVDLLMTGGSTRDIAGELGISKRTVETHCQNIYNKLGIASRADLFALTAKFDFLPCTPAGAAGGLPRRS